MGFTMGFTTSGVIMAGDFPRFLNAGDSKAWETRTARHGTPQDTGGVDLENTNETMAQIYVRMLV